MLPNQPPPTGSPPAGRSNGPAFLGVGIVILTVVAGILFALSGDDQGSSASPALAGAAADEPGSATVEADVPTDSTLPGATIPPAAAQVDDCVQVSYSGDILGTGSCVDGSSPYVVTEVLDTGGGCANTEDPWIDDGSHRLCLELNLEENRCYDFPDPGSTDWLVPALACEEPGTVAVVDIVPGATDDSGCTTQYEWNRWYAFTTPVMVACVMEF